MQAKEAISEIVSRHIGREGPLLPILHDVQSAYGCVDAAAEAEIADALNLSRADVHGVVSFYHDFTGTSDPKPEVQICRAEACKARGVEGIMKRAREVAGDRVTLTDVYCLGLCTAGPNARIGDDLHARLSEDSLARLIESV